MGLNGQNPNSNNLPSEFGSQYNITRIQAVIPLPIISHNWKNRHKSSRRHTHKLAHIFTEKQHCNNKIKGFPVKRLKTEHTAHMQINNRKHTNTCSVKECTLWCMRGWTGIAARLSQQLHLYSRKLNEKYPSELRVWRRVVSIHGADADEVDAAAAMSSCLWTFGLCLKTGRFGCNSISCITSSGLQSPLSANDPRNACGCGKERPNDPLELWSCPIGKGNAGDVTSSDEQKVECLEFFFLEGEPTLYVWLVQKPKAAQAREPAEDTQTIFLQVSLGQG